MKKNLWSEFEKKLAIPLKDRPGVEWKTIEEISQYLGLSLSAIRQRIKNSIKKGEMEKTIRLYQSRTTIFYRPSSK